MSNSIQIYREPFLHLLAVHQDGGLQGPVRPVPGTKLALTFSRIYKNQLRVKAPF